MAEFTALIPPTDSPSPAAAGPYPNDLPRPRESAKPWSAHGNHHAAGAG